MSISLDRVTTRSQSRGKFIAFSCNHYPSSLIIIFYLPLAIEEVNTRRFWGSLPRRCLPYVSLDRIDPTESKPKPAVKRKYPAGSVNEGNVKRRKTKVCLLGFTSTYSY